MKNVVRWLVAVVVVASPLNAADSRLVGVWDTEVYKVAGKDYPMDGIFIFTETYFSANAFFRVSGGKQDDLNANAGTYHTDGNRLVFMQQVQAHVRPGDEKEPIFYGRGVEEAATYAIEGDQLIITFPSSNQYVCKRVP
jgi:hypothetical protein